MTYLQNITFTKTLLTNSKYSTSECIITMLTRFQFLFFFPGHFPTNKTAKQSIMDKVLGERMD